MPLEQDKKLPKKESDVNTPQPEAVESSPVDRRMSYDKEKAKKISSAFKATI